MSNGQDGPERATFRIVEELAGTETLSAVYRRQSFRPHFHETYLIGVTEKGAEVFEARGTRHVSPAGSLRLFNPGEVHTGEPPAGGIWGYRCLYPSAELMTEIARETGRSGIPWFPEMVVPDARLAGELIDAFGALDRASALERSTRFHIVLARIVAAHARGPLAPQRPTRAEPRALAAARAFIGDRLAENFSLDDLSRAAGMSSYHLVRVFKARMGLTPFAYQAQLRIGRARRLLAEGRGAKRVAAECGFFDSSHMARVFRSIVGVTPAAYSRARGPQRL